MLFNELRNLTYGLVSLKEYERINAIYMECSHMTHEDAAEIWRLTYGNAKGVKKDG